MSLANYDKGKMLNKGAFGQVRAASQSFATTKAPLGHRT
jgi:hypothetical protein